MSKKAFFTECPRCGARSFEHMNEYAHCTSCLYFEDHYQDSETCFAAVRFLEAELMRPDSPKQIEETTEPDAIAS